MMSKGQFMAQSDPTDAMPLHNTKFQFPQHQIKNLVLPLYTQVYFKKHNTTLVFLVALIELSGIYLQ